MTINEIVLLIVGLVTTILSGTTIVSLFQIRNLNKKLEAEAIKLKTESNVAVFNAQIAGSNELVTTMSDRLKVVTDRLTETENKAVEREKRIANLEDSEHDMKIENSDLRRILVSLYGLVYRIVTITDNSLLDRSKIQSDSVDDFILLDRRLKSELDIVKAELSSLQETFEKIKIIGG